MMKNQGFGYIRKQQCNGGEENDNDNNKNRMQFNERFTTSFTITKACLQNVNCNCYINIFVLIQTEIFEQKLIIFFQQQKKKQVCKSCIRRSMYVGECPTRLTLAIIQSAYIVCSILLGNLKSAAYIQAIKTRSEAYRYKRSDRRDVV